MNAACLPNLRAHHADYIAFALPDSLTATMAMILLFATLLAIAAAPLVLRAYGGQVRRLMRLHQIAAPPQAWHERLRRSRVREEPSELRPDHGASPSDLERAAQSRRSVIKHATWIAYAAFVVASPVILWAGGNVAQGDVIGFYIAVPVLAAVPALVNVHPEGSKKWIFAALVVLGVVLSALDPTSEEGGIGRFRPGVCGSALSGDRRPKAADGRRGHDRLAHTDAGGPPRRRLVYAPDLLVPQRSGGPGRVGAGKRRRHDGAPGRCGVRLCGEQGASAAVVASRTWIRERHLARRGLGFILLALLHAFTISVDGPLPKWQIGIIASVWIGATLGVYGWVIHRTATNGVRRSLLLLRVFFKPEVRALSRHAAVALALHRTYLRDRRPRPSPLERRRVRTGEVSRTSARSLPFRRDRRPSAGRSSRQRGRP